ncbi:MAG: hypothetical protein A2252_07600 [Elusimicrobia bacterium RIFOXYA2_FULL_39_19]|nr:MAG: hypothetical protein A2252_07600 [Elusimicrobia bacterium RIFOXYA2_FULL_39_19]
MIRKKDELMANIYKDSFAVFTNTNLGAKLRFTFPENNVCRIQSAGKDGAFDNRGAVQTLARDFDKNIIETCLPILLKKDKNSITTIMSADSSIRVSITPTQFRIYLSENKKQNSCALLEFGPEGNSVSGQLRGKENIYGLGQRFNGVNQRKKSVNIWAEDQWNEIEDNSYVSIPFFLSTCGYGVFLNRFESSIFDLGKKNRDNWYIKTESPCLDLYVFLGNSPKKIIGAFNKLSGITPIPPQWSFSPWICRHLRLRELSSIDTVHAVIKKMETHSLPWGVIILEGWETHDIKTYKYLKTLVAELHKKGKKVLLYSTAGRLPQEYWAGLKAKPEYFVRNQQNNPFIKEAPHFNPMDAPDRRESCFIDITNQKALKWWKEKVWGSLLGDIGVDGSKIDFGEQFPEDDDIKFKSGVGSKGMHQYYPVFYNTMMYRLFQEKRPEGGLCFSRGGGIGAQRYPFIWCGDQSREFSRLRAIVSASLSSGFSGVPFMCHDMGGYIPARKNIKDDETEVFIRGVQLACFSPVMQFHGTSKPPYDFPDKVIDIYRFYSKLRYALIPYIKKQSKICCETGLPLMRHLYIEYPDDIRTLDIEDQYMFGNEILVAPVLAHSTNRNIYLPEGKWLDLWENKIYTGPIQLKKYSSPLENIPIFIRYRESKLADKLRISL